MTPQDLVTWLMDHVARDISSNGQSSMFVDVHYLGGGTAVLLDTGNQVFRIDVSEVGK
jgi:hypothetical protein